MSDTLSVLILGCGNIAGGFDENSGSAIRSHAGAYQNDPRFLIKACVEPNIGRREAFMERWGIQSGYSDLESCLATENSFDVVSVCLPTEFHSDALERLLSANIRLVFTEKPITGSLSLPIIVCPPFIEQLANLKTSLAPEVTCSKSLEFISEFEKGSCKIIKAEISLEFTAIISLIA